MRRPTADAGDAGALLRLAGRLSLEPFGPPAPRALARLVASALLVAMCVPPPLLSAMGVPYDAPTGSLLFKLHPATWLVGLALAVALVARGNPLRELGRSLAHQPATAAYLGALLAMIAWSLARFGASGAAFLIDTLLVPGLVALLLARLDLSTQKRLFTLVAVVLMGNAVLGIGEQILKVRLVPHTTFGGGIELVEEFCSGPRACSGIPWQRRVPASACSCSTARAPAARLALSLHDVRRGVALVRRCTPFAGNRRSGAAPLRLIDLARATPVERGLPTARSWAARAARSWRSAPRRDRRGARRRRADHGSLAWDDSAQAREKSLHVFASIDWQQLLFGMSPDETREPPGGSAGIGPERRDRNFWVVILLQVGALLLALFAVSLVAVLRPAGAARAASAVGLGLFGFLIVASTSNSLATKSEVFVVVILLAQLAAAYRCHGLLQDAGIGADPDGLAAAGWEAPWAGAALPARSG